MRAVIYARYSSDRQRHESIADQVRVCSQYAEREGMEVVGIYADEAQSGTTADRDQFQQMLKDARTADWSRIIVYKLDRFARDRYTSIAAKMRLRKMGVSVVSATEGIPDTPEGILMESVLEGFGEYYSKQLGQNVRRGMEGNARKCKVNGCPLYGYETAPDGTYMVKEPEASHIRAAFRMRREGYSIGTIAHELAPRMGKTYKQAYNLIRDGFSNPKYKGVYRWGDIVIPDGMPSIVSASEWEAVNAMRGKVRFKSKRASYPLAGRVYGSDGKLFHGESAKSGRYFYYSDGTYRIQRDALDAIVAESVRECMEDERLLDRLAEGTAAAAQRYDRPTRTLGEVERELQRCADVVAKIGADDALLQRIESLRIERDEIEQAEIKRKIADALTVENVREWLRNFAGAGSDEALDAFVDHVVIEHEGNDLKCITVFYNWDKTSEPVIADRFELEEFGTPILKVSNVYLYEWGFAVRVAA